MSPVSQAPHDDLDRIDGDDQNGPMHRRWYYIIAAILLADVIGLAIWLNWRRDHRYDRQIKEAAVRYDVDPALVKAIVWQESRFKAEARGGAGEIGLMQIRDLASQEWAAAEKIPNFTHEHITDPGSNVLAGTWYLSKMLKRYRDTDDPVPFALADYNAGRTKVLDWLKGPGKTNSQAFLENMDYPGTKKYIARIVGQRQKFRRDFPRVAY